MIHVSLPSGRLNPKCGAFSNVEGVRETAHVCMQNIFNLISRPIYIYGELEYIYITLLILELEANSLGSTDNKKQLCTSRTNKNS